MTFNHKFILDVHTVLSSVWTMIYQSKLAKLTVALMFYFITCHLLEMGQHILNVGTSDHKLISDIHQVLSDVWTVV